MKLKFYAVFAAILLFTTVPLLAQDNAWTLDGGYDIDTGGNWGVLLPPNMEIIAEVDAIRQNYSAEFGTGGGSQFNMISKSGTNDIHGSAYEFVQNTAFEARQYFQPTVPTLK